jgi:hypothetical protein
MKIAKVAISKEALIEIIGEKERSFLNKIDQLQGVELSEGKWKKLYALVSEARKKSNVNYFVYESPNLTDYDTSIHKMYPHLFGEDRVALWHSIRPEPKKHERKNKIKYVNNYLENHN